MGLDSGQQEPWWRHAERDSDNDATFDGLCDQQEAIEAREDLATFIQALHDDL